MEISKAEVEKILKTLPIGFYTLRKVPIVLNEESECSYYCPPTDDINISFQQIALSCKKAPMTFDKERLIRTNLYHEVSHAILTPTIMKINDIMNIFEDERIETILQNYYMNVDFVTEKYYVNGLEVGEVPLADNPINSFYNLVRFHSGKKELLQEVDRIIQKYAKLTRQSGYWDCQDYVHEVEQLFQKLCDDMKANPKDYQNSNSIKSKEEQNSNSIKSKDNPTTNEEEKEKNKKGKTSVNVKTAHGMSKDEIQKTLDNAIKVFAYKNYDKEIYDKFNLILTNFKKKNSGGSSLRSYSGILNPRLVANNDYKFFERSSNQRGNGNFGTLHLNLFIDKSGSFWHSQDLVNKMINALSAIERQNPNFSLDLVFCGIGQEVIAKKEDRVLRCDGGNNLTDDIYEIFRSLQKPQVYNYNIVLFDGDAYSNSRERNPKGFGAFNTNNTTIISDQDNKVYIEKRVNKAKVIYTRNYADELIKNVTQSLEKAFR